MLQGWQPPRGRNKTRGFRNDYSSFGSRHTVSGETDAQHDVAPVPFRSRQWRDFQAKPESSSDESTTTDEEDEVSRRNDQPGQPSLGTTQAAVGTSKATSLASPSVRDRGSIVRDATGWYDWQVPVSVQTRASKKPLVASRRPATTRVPHGRATKVKPLPQKENNSIPVSDTMLSDSEATDAEYLTDDASSTCSFRYGTEASEPSETFLYSDQGSTTGAISVTARVSIPRTSDLSEEFRSASLAYSREAKICPDRIKSAKRRSRSVGACGTLETSTRASLSVSPPPDTLKISEASELKLKNGEHVASQSSLDALHRNKVTSEAASEAFESGSTVSASASATASAVAWDPSLDVNPELQVEDIEEPFIQSGSKESLQDTTRQHSRAQSEKLRQYATLYVEFSRDPWKWHENRDFVREVMPRLDDMSAIASSTTQTRSSNPSNLRYPEHAGVSNNNPDHVTENELLYRGRPTSPGPPRVKRPRSPASTRKTRQQERRLQPLDRALYCEKCKRHFRSTWHMQGHLTDSQLHPYYCKICYVDWPTFKARFEHWADSPRCRPPEFEYGAGKPFMEILADAQRMPSRRDIKGALSDDALPPPSFAEAGGRHVDLSDPEAWESRPPSPDSKADQAFSVQAHHPSSSHRGMPSSQRVNYAQGGDVGQDALAFRRPRLLPPVPSTEELDLRKARPLEPTKVYEAPLCPICMIPLVDAKELLLTACGHIYCASCVLHYFSKEKPNCPKCRTPVSMATVIPLELR